MDNFDYKQFLVENRLTTNSRRMLKENEEQIPEDIKIYLLSMIDDFSDGNDNYYSIGQELESRFEKSNQGNEDWAGEEGVLMFNKALEYVKSHPNLTIYDGGINDETFKYKTSEDGNDIIATWENKVEMEED